MKELVEILKNKGLTIASAESLTGGLFSSRIVEVPGASKVFIGTVVTYATRIKHEVVGVNQITIDTYGVVSKETANEMAKGISKLMKSDVGISFTGNAGPDTMEGKPCGLVYSSVYFKNKIYSFEDLLQGNRNEIRNQIVDKMIKRIIRIVNGEEY